MPASSAARHTSDEGFVRFSSSPYEPQRPPVRSLDEIDLLDFDLYRLGDPHAAWKLMREQAPVFWHERGSRGTEDKGFWALTRYDDCAAVYRDSVRFSSEFGPFLDLRVEDTPPGILASIDGRRHRLRRGIVARFFTPQALHQWNEAVHRVVARLLDDVAERGECDFSVDIAQKLPILATSELLGISAPEVQSLVDLLFSLGGGSADGLQDYNQATLEFFSKVSDTRRASGHQGSIIDAINAAEIEGDPIGAEDIAELLWILFFGGIDSTVHAVTGGMLALFHNPDQLDLIRENPGLADKGVEEILRWTSTSHANKRKVMEDVEIRGVTIRKGDYVSMWSPSANRDEEAFPDPYRFDLQRSFSRSTQIATFGGGGPHQCIGQFFARLEVKALFEQLFARFPDLQQAGPAVRSDHFTILLSPIEHLPIRYGQTR